MSFTLDFSKIAEAIKLLGGLASILLFVYLVWSNGSRSKAIAKEAAHDVINELTQQGEK